MWPPRVRFRSPEPRIAALAALPLHWISYGIRKEVPGLLGSVWRPWSRGWSTETRMVAVGALSFPWASSGGCGVVNVHLVLRLAVVGALLVPWAHSRRLVGLLFPRDLSATPRECGRSQKSSLVSEGCSLSSWVPSCCLFSPVFVSSSSEFQVTLGTFGWLWGFGVSFMPLCRTRRVNCFWSPVGRGWSGLAPKGFRG